MTCQRPVQGQQKEVGLLTKLIGNTGSFTFWENKKNHLFGIYVHVKMFAFLFYLSPTMESQLPQHPLGSLHNRQRTQREVKKFVSGQRSNQDLKSVGLCWCPLIPHPPLISLATPGHRPWKCCHWGWHTHWLLSMHNTDK